MNKVILIGNVGGDPVIREVGDQKVASFTLATSERYRGKDGNPVTVTEWHNVSFWGKTAEVVQKYVVKGSQIYVEGKIKSEKYTDKEGNDRVAFRIRGEQMQLLGRKEEGSQQQSQPAPAAPQTPRYNTTPIANAGDPEDGDLPF